MKPSDNSDAFYQRYGLRLPSSSLSTLYNDNGMKMCEELIKRSSLMNSVETQINRTQRPTMMIDLNYILIREYRDSGQNMSYKELQQRGKQLYLI